ncbi:MAG: DnaD domain protein [Defluviitaleaceae bacterium]|nr:DnaD domain protein [Defluviitaleaceae bacterium]
MSDIKMKLAYKCSVLEIPVLFIDEYMTNCLPVYPLIYLWSLRRLLNGESATTQEISESFRLTEGDVIKAWQHWENEGLISISSEKQNTEITFLPVPAKKNTPKIAELSELSELSAPSHPPESRPQYSTQELAHYRNESLVVERLFSHAEKTLGKLLSYNDMNVIFGFLDWLRLPADVIEFLLSYCEENDRKNLRYIEKCAIDWADNNISDVEQALIYVQNFDRDYKAITRHMGQASFPTPAQKKYMKKWLHEWNFPLEIVTEACDRCVEQIAKPNYKYVDKILSEWQKKGATDLKKISEADEEFASDSKKILRAPTKIKQNRFANFNQRETDYSQYEKLERAYLDKIYNS